MALPLPFLPAVAAFLPLPDLLRLERVSRAWLSLLRSPSLHPVWAALYAQAWPASPPPAAAQARTLLSAAPPPPQPSFHYALGLALPPAAPAAASAARLAWAVGDRLFLARLPPAKEAFWGRAEEAVGRVVVAADGAVAVGGNMSATVFEPPTCRPTLSVSHRALAALALDSSRLYTLSATSLRAWGRTLGELLWERPCSLSLLGMWGGVLVAAGADGLVLHTRPPRCLALPAPPAALALGPSSALLLRPSPGPSPSTALLLVALPDLLPAAPFHVPGRFEGALLGSGAKAVLWGEAGIVFVNVHTQRRLATVPVPGVRQVWNGGEGKLYAIVRGMEDGDRDRLMTLFHSLWD